MARQDAEARQELAAKGCRVNAVKPVAFRDMLSSSGYDKEWRRRFGDEVWSLLERHAGPPTRRR